MLLGFLLGLAGALLLLAPLAFVLARRAARRDRALRNHSLQIERLAELGTLTGGLAHEIKNPLATLRLNLDLLEEEWQGDDDPELRRRSLNKLGTLRREAQRLEDTLEDFLRYAGQHELHVETVDLNRLLAELLDFYEPQASAGRLRVRRGLTDQPLPVRLDADLFKQAVLNLLINAQQAMADGGELIVRTQAIGETVQLEVADTGPGIPPDRAERIFQAYYSTKRGGTGLGLPTTRRIVAEHGGTIDVHSDAGQGTSFTIRLPRAQA